MRGWRSTGLAWRLWGSAVALSAVSLVFLGLSAGAPAPPGFGFEGSEILFALTFATVGRLVAARQPRNPVGWLFGVAGLIFAAMGLAGEYADYAVLTRPGLPLGPEVAWAANWIWPSSLGLVACVFLLFPDGELLSGRWRALLWVIGVSVELTFIGFGIAPGPMDEFPAADNPFGVDGAGRAGPLVAAAGMLGLGAAMLGAGVSLVLRFRRSRGRQRQQLKWIAYAAGLAGSSQLAGIVWFAWSGRAPAIVAALVIIGLTAIPVAAGVAILRHRLYDIDRLINRTLVYGLLTLLLAATYAAGVFVLGGLLNPAGGDSAFAVAASTLTVAALFQPLRRRVQSGVDRRFNRRRYDAARTVEAFSARLRDQIGLETVAGDLVTAVEQVMEPTRVSLWIRRPPG
jgi:hypothetical protein